MEITKAGKQFSYLRTGTVIHAGAHTQVHTVFNEMGKKISGRVTYQRERASVSLKTGLESCSGVSGGTGSHRAVGR